MLEFNRYLLIIGVQTEIIFPFFSRDFISQKRRKNSLMEEEIPSGTK